MFKSALLSVFMLVVATQAVAEDRYFPYPKLTQIKSLDPKITSITFATDLVINPNQASVDLINESNHSGDRYTSNVCRLDFAPAEGYRRILADTVFALDSVVVGGDRDSWSDRDAAFVLATLRSDMGFMIKLTCSSSWSDYYEDRDLGTTYIIGGSTNDHDVSDLSKQLNFFRLETIVTAPQ